MAAKVVKPLILTVAVLITLSIGRGWSQPGSVAGVAFADDRPALEPSWVEPVAGGGAAPVDRPDKGDSSQPPSELPGSHGGDHSFDNDFRDDPVADPDGPYYCLPEDLADGGWTFTFDGSGSQPAESLVMWQWDFGTDTCDGTWLNTHKWIAESAMQDDAILVRGGNTWTGSYVFTREVDQRASGMSFRARVTYGGNDAVWGFKNTNTNYHYDHVIYGMYLGSGGQIYIFESGSNRGVHGYYTPGEPIDLRIDLKPDSGALYYAKQPGDSWEGSLIYDSNHSSATEFRRGVTAYNGLFQMDDIRELYGGETISHKVYVPGPVTLTVEDNLGQQASADTEVIVENPDLLPDANGPYIGTADNRENAGWEFLFDASATESPFEIVDYEWDMGWETFPGQWLNPNKWFHANAFVDDMAVLIGTGGWNASYLVTRESMPRGAGNVAEARVTLQSHNGVWGLKILNDNYHYNYFRYAIYTYSDNYVYIYESGSHRATPATFITGETYDLRIELKPINGARYFMKLASEDEWTLLYDSDYGDDAEYRVGVSIASGRYELLRQREVFFGETPTHYMFWGGPGTLTVRDTGGQTATADFDVIIDPPTPTADAGGPYALQENAFNVDVDGWDFTFDSTNTASGHEVVTQEWDFGVDTCDGLELDYNRYLLARAYQNDEISFWPTGGWGGSYAFTKQIITRQANAMFQARVRPGSGINGMWGLKNTNTNYHYNYMRYALYFNSNQIRVYESGSDRGVVGGYEQDAEYDVAIVLKNTTGADYYIKPADSQEWTLLYTSMYSEEAELRGGVTIAGGAFAMDDVVLKYWGQTLDRTIAMPQDVTLTVVDSRGQVSSDTTFVDIQGTAPVADAGGSFDLTEAHFLATGFMMLDFDATNSVDDFEIDRYRWDFGTLTFDGIRGGPGDFWYRTGDTRDDMILVTGTGSWGNAYASERDVYYRGEGAYMQCAVRPDPNHAMYGFKNTSTSYHYNQFVYAMYFNTGHVSIYEGGNSRGTFGSYDPAQDYEILIQLKEIAGATYWYRTVGEDNWTFLYDSDYSSNTEFLRGFTVHSGTFGLDNLRQVFATPVVSYRTTNELTATLTVWDHVGRSDTDTSEVIISGTDPLADAGGPYIAPLGSYAVLDGSGSTDDYGIAQYEWDFGDGTYGLGEFVSHQYDTPGVYNATLTVYDASGRSSFDTTIVDVQPMTVTVPWDYDTVSGLEVPHNTWSGLDLRLKARVFTDTPVEQLTYTWTFGDGSDPEDGTLTDTRSIETWHAYTGAPGAVFVATLTVHDPVYGDLSDTHPVQIHDQDLTIEVNVAIEEGLWWLHKEQEGDGSWSQSNYRSSLTASCVQAMEINGHLPTRPVSIDPLVEDVIRGLNAVFVRLSSAGISMEPYGDPDTNANGIGIQVTDGQPIYQGGMVMDAIAASGEPNMVANVGAVGIIGRTHRTIVQDMGDMYAWGQENSGNARGGWRYSWDGGSDNSACQWAAIGYLGAQAAFGLEWPDWIKEENNLWLTYSYDGTGFGYTGPGNGQATTPSGMVQLAYDGYTREDPRWQTAEAWLANNWEWWKTRNDVYAWYAFAKAMRLALPEPVVELQPTGLDWYNDSSGLVRYILNRQNDDGSWPQPSYVNSRYATAWQVIILTPTLFTRPPVAVAGPDIVWAFDLELTFDGSGSYHTDPVRVLVQYEWDFDGDGVYDYVGEDPVTSYTFVFDPGIDYPVTYLSRLRVTDDIGQVDTDTRLVTIAEPPHAPFAVAAGPYIARVGVPFTPDSSGSYDIDPTDYITRVEWDFDGSDGYDFDDPDAFVECAEPEPGDPQTGGCPPIAWTFDTPGVYNIGLRVWDNGVLNAPDFDPLPSLPDFTVVTVELNTAPVADAGGPYEVTECIALQLDGSGSYDPNGDPITFAWDLDEDGVYDDATEVAPTYTWDEQGDYFVSVIVSDGPLDSEPADADVVVYDSAPSIAVTGPVALDLDQEGTFTASVVAGCDALGEIEWDWDYDGISFIPSGDTGSAATHAYPVQGTYTVAALVTDDDGSEALGTHIVVVAPPEGPRVPAEERIGIIIGRRDYDPANQIHRGEFTLISEHDQPITGPIALAFNNIDPPTVTVANPDGYVEHPEIEGLLIPYVDFSDMLIGNVLMPGESAGPKWIDFNDPDNVAFEFEAYGYLFNTAPRFTSNPVLTGSEGTRYRYDVNAVDDDGDVFAYALQTAPEGMTINPVTGLIDWVPGQTAGGVYDIVVAVDDGHAGGQAEQAYQLTIASVNIAPVITSLPITTGSGTEAYVYQVEAYDPDGDPIDFAFISAPDGMTIDPDTGLVEWPLPVMGYHQIKISVMDDHANEVRQDYRLSIDDCDRPIFTTTPPTDAAEGVLYTYQPEVTGPNPPYEYDLLVAPTGMTIEPVSGLIEWTPGQTAAGSHVVKIIAQETAGDCMQEQIFQITVTGVNVAPQITSDPPLAATEGQTYIYDVQAFEPDGDPITYSLPQAPAGMSILPGVGRITWYVPQTAAAMCNPCDVRVRACDPSLACDEQIFQIDITEVNVAPSFVSTPNYFAEEDELYLYLPTVIDPDEDTLLFELLDGPDTMTIDPDTGLLEWTPTQTDAAANPHFVSMAVSDGNGGEDSQVFEIIVRSVNLPPEITSTPATDATEGVLYAYLVQATDPDEDTLHFRLLEHPSGMSIHPNTGLITWVPSQTAANDNPHTVTVEAYDPFDAADQQTYEIVVTAVNVAPIFFSDPVLQGAAGQEYVYDADAVDPDEDTVEYDLSTAPAGMTIDSVTGEVTWSPGPLDIGFHDVVITADDLNGHMVPQSYTLEVLECGTAPEFLTDPITRVQIGDVYQYQVVAQVEQGNITFALGEAPDGMTIGETTGLVEWTPEMDDEGQHTVQIIATSDEDCDSIQEYTLEARYCVLSVEYLFGEGENEDPDAGRYWTASPTIDATCGPLEFGFLQYPSTMSINPETGVLSWLPVSGQWLVRIYVVDDWNNYDEIEIPLDIAPQNPPQITSTPTFVAAVNVLYTYDVDAFDPDGDPIEYSLGQAPAGMVIDADSGLVEWTPTMGQLGVHEVTVRASDDRGAWMSQTYTLTVSEFGDNVSPQITTTPPFSAAVEEEYVYDVDATDGDGDPVQFGLDEAPAGMVIDADTGIITWTPTVEQIGVHAVKVRATDGRGGWATQAYSLTVSQLGDNTAPQITSTPTFTAAVGAVYVYDVEAIDDEEDPLVFSLVSHEGVEPPADMTIDADTGWIEWLPTEDDLGTHMIKVRVEDDRGGWATQAYALTVSFDGDNTPPRITSTPDGSAAIDELYAYQVVAVDDEEDPLEYELIDGPGTMVIGASDGLIEWTPTVSDIGMHLVKVGVSDGRGGLATQQYMLAVSTDGNNTPPRFTSTPVQRVLVDTPYSYDANAVDDNAGDEVTYSLDTAPEGMSINSTTGLLAWTPGMDDLGANEIIIRATDTQEAWVLQSFELVVAENSPPDFDSTPLAAAVADVVYDYAVHASDPDNHAVTYQLVPAMVGEPPVEYPVPDGMTITQPLTAGGPAHVLWTPTLDQVGGHWVAIHAADGHGGEATQTYEMMVFEDESADYRPPEVRIGIEPKYAAPGETVTITVVASDDIGLAGVEATLDGEPLDLVQQDSETFTAVVPAGAFGRHDISVTATDLFGKTRTKADWYMVYDEDDQTPPVVEITSPVMDEEVGDLVPVIGTVMDDDLVAWRLEYAPSHTENFVALAEGFTNVENDEIVVFDVSMVPNGLYDIRLTAEDAGGFEAFVITRVLVDTNRQVGNFTMTFDDLQLPVVGVPVIIKRTYDSRMKYKGDFGVGWKLEIASAEVVKNDDLHEGWETGFDGGGWLPLYYVLPDRLHTVTIDLGDGRTETFDMEVNPSSMYIYSFWDASVTWRRRGQGFSTLRSSPTDCLVMNGMPILTWDFEDWNPTGFTYTDNQGNKFTFTGEGKRMNISAMEDENGNTLTFTQNGIFHSAGRSVLFERDDEERITRITDPDGNEIVYTYDDDGNLVAVTDRDENTSHFGYNYTHGLLEIEDPNGNVPVRNEFDDAGRLVATVDSDGNRMEFARDIDARQELVYDRLGNLTIYYYDEFGNVTKITDADNHDTDYTFDEFGNLLTKVNYLGQQMENTFTDEGRIETRRQFWQTAPTSYTYDEEGRILSRTDPSGLVETRTYDDDGNLLTVGDNTGRLAEYTYLSNGRIQTKTIHVAEGVAATWTYEYNEQGDRTAEIDPLGSRTEFEYNELGLRTLLRRQRTLPDGSVQDLVTTYTYDNSGRILTETDPLNNVRTYEYDALGKRISLTDRRDKTTYFEYDARGDMVKKTYPDGSFETYAYDAEQRRNAMTDRGGRTTQYEYNHLGNVTRTVHDDESYIELTYDGLGRVLSARDELDNVTTYEYVDDADTGLHQQRVTDANDKTTVHDFDDMDRRIRTTDALGHVTEFEYDLAGRMTKTTFHDDTFVEYEYDRAGRKVAETDQAGRRTEYEYDLVGRLVAVTDAAGHVTSYGYDELGQLRFQTDAEGRVTEYQYDELGRMTRRILPGGQFESMTFDAEGNMLSHVDFEGNTTTYEHDDMGRLTLKTFEGGATEVYTYTPCCDKVETVTTAAGVTNHTYDDRGRLESITYPNGQVVSYGYDLHNNRTSVTTSLGTTTYTYDDLNRLETVTDPDDLITTYVYNDVGSIAAVHYPNGTTATYTYDDLNRLAHVTHTLDGSGELLAGFEYTVGPAGNRTQVVESNAAGPQRTVTYEYDPVYRLTQEQVAPADGEVSVVDYTYDTVGNRLSKVTATGTSLEAVTYGYDTNDHLLTESAESFEGGNPVSTTETTYTYDLNGHMRTRSDGTSTDTFDYNYACRLIGAHIESDGDPRDVAYTYDHRGIRTSMTVGDVTTQYVVDPNRTYEQVVVEITPDGSTGYVYGHDLLTMKRPDGTKSFYHSDGQLSTRLLTDAGGAVTDTYAFDAFGNTLARTGSTQNSYLYTGEQYDANVGFYYLRQRYMDPRSGRFITMDLFPDNPFEPQSLHRYLYGQANPVNRFDPTGEFGTLIEINISISIQNTLVTSYHSMLIKTFFTAVRIAFCVIEPAAQQRQIGLDAIAEGAGDWAVVMVTQAQQQIAIALNELRQAIADNLEEFADEILPQLEWDYTIEIVDTGLDDYIEALQAAHEAWEEVQDFQDQLLGWLGQVEDMWNTMEDIANSPSEACAISKFLEAYGLDILEYVGVL